MPNFDSERKYRKKRLKTEPSEPPEPPEPPEPSEPPEPPEPPYLYFIEALREGWSLTFPGADLSWITSTLSNIVDIKVGGPRPVKLSEHLKSS